MIKIAPMLIVASVFGVTGCAVNLFNTSPEVPGLEAALPVQTMIEPDSGASATLKPGGQLRIELISNPTTGYFWTWLAERDADAVGLVQENYIGDAAPEGITGVGGRQVFLFEGQAPGKTRLVFHYQRSDEDRVETRKINLEVIE